MSAGAVRRAALDYLRRGWSAIPIRPREKIPLVPWEPFQSRRATEDELEEWLRRWPEANIGIVTGEISNLAVLDVDPQHGGDASLRDLEARNGALPVTVEARTGGGGRHIYFAFPLRTLRNRAGIAPGLDLRAKGGMVVAPPSIHPSGRGYEWVKDRSPAVCAPAAMPLWLLRLAAGAPGRRGHSVGYWRALVREGVAEGTRNSTIASLTGYLLWHGIDPAVATELLLCWNRVLCRPPLDDAEVVRTVASIARLHAEREEITPAERE